MPEVSVIVPNFNHAPFLKKRIDSIVNQSFQDFEIIILDDCSSDNSFEQIEQYRQHSKVSKIIYNKVNSGSPFRQWKMGISLAKGKYIWIAESDDWADKDFLFKVVSNIEKSSSIALSYCRSFRVDLDNKVVGLHEWGRQLDVERWEKNFVNNGKNEIEGFLRFMNTMPNASAVLFRAERGKKVINTIPESMAFCGDWLFWLRLIKDYEISFHAEPLNYFRRHPSTSIAWKNSEKERKRVQEYFIVINEACEVSGERIRNGLNKYDWILDEWYGKRKNFKNISDYYFPPFPPKLLIRFYYINLKSHLLNIYRQLRKK